MDHGRGTGCRWSPGKGAQGHLIGNTAAGGAPKCDWGQCRPPYLCTEENIFELYTKPAGLSVGLYMIA